MQWLLERVCYCFHSMLGTSKLSDDTLAHHLITRQGKTKTLGSHRPSSVLENQYRLLTHTPTSSQGPLHKGTGS